MKRIIRRLSALLCVLSLCLTPASALSVDDAITLLEIAYVDELPAAAYTAETLDELFDIIGDPYTYYMPANAYESFQEDVEGEISVNGVGITIEYTAEGILIASILDGGSAKEAGLRPGDCIIAIGGVSCAPAAEAHRDLIRGEAGTFVDLTVRRAGEGVRDYHLERRPVVIRNTTVTSKDGVGCIDCDSFGSETVGYFFEALTDDPDTRLWVVDLRNNTGGYADAAVLILGAFTGIGKKLIYLAGNGESIASHYASEPLTDKPVIVLVNGFSASSSEILAGGIRAEKAGIVLGSRTYGKGSAQIVYDESSFPELFDGDALKITTYRFYNGDGCTTDRIGVLPTLLIDDALADDVAALLSPDAPEGDEYLALTLNGIPFYLDLSGEGGAARTELLSALPPDASVARIFGNSAEKLSAAQALARYGDAAASRCFTDVADSPYATQINTLGTYGILGGVGGGRFAPDAVLTRAELAAMLAQALDLASGPAGLFSDVPDGRWYTEKIGAVSSFGLMNGTGGGAFEPDAGLTQEQFIAVMGRLARFLNCNADAFAGNSAELALADGPLSAFAPWVRSEAYVLSAYGGNMLYTQPGEIDPHAGVTRAQAAATLCNILKTLHTLSY